MRQNFKKIVRQLLFLRNHLNIIERLNQNAFDTTPPHPPPPPPPPKKRNPQGSYGTGSEIKIIATFISTETRMMLLMQLCFHMPINKSRETHFQAILYLYRITLR